MAVLANNPNRNNGVPKGPRSAVAKRRTALRADKDGDLAMDGSIKGRGGISKPSPANNGAGDTASKARRAAAQKLREAALARGLKDKTIRPGDARTYTGKPVDVSITGWADSKSSADTDSIITSLIAWLEKKATLKSPTKKVVRVKRQSVDDQTLVISAQAADVGSILRLNNFVFAGANLKIERAAAAADSQTTQDTIAMLKGVLARRYNPELKLLDLSALGQDPDLKASTIFDNRSTTSKFFPALMKVLDQQFTDAAQKHEAMQSVTLANNDLPDISVVTTLSHTIPKLKNLDLSNNKLSKLDDISAWRKRFLHLDHLILSGNPIEQAEPDLAKTLLSWYPHLRIINTTQMRSDEEAAQPVRVPDLPFPIRTPVFQDEGQIAENFIRTFFTGYDADRAELARLYYDQSSDFSYSVNTAAPRDPNATESGPQGWDAYIKNSRNLKKITHLSVRQSRHSRGTEAVASSWAQLPATRHPDLAAEAQKWSIECQLQPGLPDPSGQAAGGVDGFLITIHGEFDEIDVSTAQSTKKRSFDRTFIIGPGGPGGVRVINDMMVVRAYGGIQAFEPDDRASAPAAPVEMPEAAIPAGLTPELAEQMVLELQKQTNMTLGYAKDCLEQVVWDFDKSLQAFAAVRANLPPEAFMPSQA